MAAEQVEHTNSPTIVAEHHQVLTQDSDAYRKVLQVFGKRHGEPEAAEVLAAGSTGPNPDEITIRLGDFAGAIAPVLRFQEWCPGCHDGLSLYPVSHPAVS
jgi:hypothetical protein